MSAPIANRIATVLHRLEPGLQRRLRGALPAYRLLTHGPRHPSFDGQQALTVVKGLAPAAGPEAWHEMAACLVALSGVMPGDAGASATTGRPSSLSEAGEMASLQLQRAMDTDARLRSTLSNLLRQARVHAGDTTSNLK
jgi:hypothetical protein